MIKSDMVYKNVHIRYEDFITYQFIMVRWQSPPTKLDIITAWK